MMLFELSGLRVFLFFLFKHKTAYEMRSSDWSSDVCSSDLVAVAAEVQNGNLDPAALIRQDPREMRVRSIAEITECHLLGCWHFGAGRSEERRVGKECVSTCRSRWSPYH